MPTLSVTDASVAEDDPSKALRFEVLLDRAAAVPVTVRYATTAGTATAPGDFESAEGLLSFPAGVRSADVVIAVSDDATFERDEVLTLTLSAPTNASIGRGVATGLILEDETPPVLSVLAAAVDEGAGGSLVTFDLELSAESTLEASVDYETADGTAIAGDDYVQSRGTARFPPGVTTLRIAVPVIDDAIDEHDEEFVLQFSAASELDAPSAAIGTVIDDDTPPRLDISGAELVESSALLEFAVSLDAVSGKIVSVAYASADSSATAGVDYVVTEGTLELQPGETSRIIAVPILPDASYEGQESFLVNLSSPINASLAGGTAFGTIIDDDPPPPDPPARALISDINLAEGDAGTSIASLTVSLSGAAASDVRLDYATVAGTATASLDFLPTSGVLEIPAGATLGTIDVEILGDIIYELDEEFHILLSNPQGSLVLDDTAATVVIEDDDDAPELMISDAELLEGDFGSQSANLLVTLSHPGGITVSVEYASLDGLAQTGQDYTGVTGSLEFEAGVTSRSIVVSVLGDLLDEADETFDIVLSEADGAGIADGLATVTVLDDDGTPSISIEDVQVGEGDSGTTQVGFILSLSAASGLPVSVDFASADGSASAGSDYLAEAGTASFPVGATSQSILVEIVGDALVEVDESFSINLSNPVNAIVSTASAEALILDDDGQPLISVSDSSVSESDAGTLQLAFAVMLSDPSPADVSVSYATSDGSALADLDYVAVTGSLTIPAGSMTGTIEVDINGDLLDEADETLTLILTNAVNAGLLDATASGMIFDNDLPPSLSIGDASINEGDSGTVMLAFPVYLSAVSGLPISIGYATANDSASAGSDYTAATGALNIDPGVGGGTIVVSVLGDGDEEPDESLFLDLSSPDNVTLADNQAVGTIVNDDVPPPWGLDSRPGNLSCVAPDRPIVDATIALSEPFPDLPSFLNPVAMAQPPGDDTLWFVAEQSGVIRYFENDPAASATTIAIDIASQVQDSPGNELGLLGIAFHPGYSDPESGHAGELFLSYTSPGPMSRVSRFTTADNWGSWTEDVILELAQDFENHNGGNIAFGPDGYLYIGFGDGGNAHDPFDRAEDTTNLLGAMLRIDVDGPAPYGIPSGNPFAGNPVCPADHSSITDCPEIYAWGLRNPWRWSFDSGSGHLWLGDVGQGAWEEVNRIEVGGNYGWDIREGAHCHEPVSGCDTTGLIDPVAEYDHSLGQSVVGGFVYRGSAIPDLTGKFLFADAYSGRIWTLEDDGSGAFTRVELLDTNGFFSSFAQGNDGELYLLDLADGGIVKIVGGSGGGGVNTIPDLLADTGCFNDMDPTQPASGLIPYTINAPFWSDGADKERFLALPDGTTMSVDADDDWILPPGAVIVKHFRLAGELFETRLLMRHPDGVWAGYTYEWNDDGTSATRVIGGKTATVNGQEWIFPSEGECDSCHTQAAGGSLGLESAQVNGEFTYPSTGRTANQLVTLDHIQVIVGMAPGLPAGQPRLADPADTGESLADRARAYLHTNCAQCHQPTGPTPSTMDLRYQSDLAGTNTCDVVPLLGDLGVVDARLIAPGDSARSILLNRMSRRDAHGMPPLGSNAVDTSGAALISDWIDSLVACN